MTRAEYMRQYYWSNRDKWLARLNPNTADIRKRLRDTRCNGQFVCAGIGKHGADARVFIDSRGHRSCLDCRAIRTKAWRSRTPAHVTGNKERNRKAYLADPDKYKLRALNRRKTIRAINDLTLAQMRLINVVFTKCAYCLDGGKLELEHVMPLSVGGGNTLTNLVKACESCNDKKHTQTWKPLLKFGF